MPKLVITSKDPDLEIGSVYQGLEKGPWKYGALPDQRYLVIGTATESEWIESNVALGAPRDHLQDIIHVNGPWYYYEIQTD